MVLRLFTVCVIVSEKVGKGLQVLHLRLLLQCGGVVRLPEGLLAEGLGGRSWLLLIVLLVIMAYYFLGTMMPIDKIVDKSISQSITRSLNTNICTLLSIAVGYIFAFVQDIPSIKSFALPMIFGIISGCYSTICIAGPIWASWQKNKEKKAEEHTETV